jgi:hypothetical protein
MKGQFLSMVWTCALAFGLGAQTWPFQVAGTPVNPSMPLEKTGDAWTVDLFVAENQNEFFVRSYHVNMNFPADSARMRYAVAGFDTLVSGDTLRHFQGKQPLPFTLDSVEITLRHVQTFGSNDTLIVDVVVLDDGGFPTLQVLHADTLVVSQSLSSGGFSPFYFLKQKNIPAETAIGIRVRFWGNPQGDTLQLLAGANANGACLPGLSKPVKSRFSPQAFAYYAGFELLVPNNGGGEFYSDCNQNNLFDSLVDGASPVQTWNMRLFVQGPSLQQEEPSSDVLSLFPNPGKGEFAWLVADQAPVTFTDAHGRTAGFVHSTAPGHYQLPDTLPPGVYFIRAGKQVRTYILLP